MTRRAGRPKTITPEARAWLVSLACRKPAALGYLEELWTTCLLAHQNGGNRAVQGRHAIVSRDVERQRNYPVRRDPPRHSVPRMVQT